MFWFESAGAIVESLLVVDSPLLLQATNVPAIATTAKSFFIVPGFSLLMAAKIVGCAKNTNFALTKLPHRHVVTSF
jgi:hypothetical protein